MDYMLDIIINKSDITKAELEEVLCEWNWITYSRSPALYITESDIEFYEAEDPSYYGNMIGVELSKDVIYLHLKSDIFHDFEYTLNCGTTNAKEDRLYDFLIKLAGLKMFYAIFCREDETVRECCKITSEDDIETVLSNNLNWSNPKDFCIYKTGVDV